MLSSWAKIGAVPLTRKCLGHKEVRQEVGGDAPHSARLEALGEQHRKNQKAAQAAGLNAGHFDATVPTYSHAARAPSAEGRVEALVASSKITTGSLWQNVGAVAVNSWKVFRTQDLLSAKATKTAAEKKEEDAGGGPEEGGRGGARDG